MITQTYKVLKIEEEGNRDSKNYEWVYQKIDETTAKRICRNTGRIEMVEIRFQENTDFEKIYESFYKKEIPKVNIESIYGDGSVYNRVVRGILVDITTLNVTAIEDELYRRGVNLDIYHVYHPYGKHIIIGEQLNETDNGIINIENIQKPSLNDDDMTKELEKIGFTKEDVKRIEIKTYFISTLRG